MDDANRLAATTAAISLATTAGLGVDEAVILQDSNRLTLRLLPANLVARAAPLDYRPNADFEVEVARQLALAAAPVAALDPRFEPRVYEHEGYLFNLWAYYEPDLSREPSPAEYASVLQSLHAGMRQVDVASPHFTHRVAEALEIVDNPAISPRLSDADRAFLGGTLRSTTNAITAGGAPEQLLHGEPHPGNIVRSAGGLRFFDFETCCRGPVEFDLASLPEAVSEHYPNANGELLRQCRRLATALVASWRWDRNDAFPGGHQMGLDLLRELRRDLPG